jgi:Tol biopolymer transport system component
LIPHLAGSVLSESFSPNGKEIAIIEGIKLYTVDRDGAYLNVWMEQDETIRPIGGAVWSPDGSTIAFVVDYKQGCPPCRAVGLVHLASGQVRYLEGPANQATDLPRWTGDNHLLVTVHNGEPANGVVYIYNTSGGGVIASSSYILSSSHEGQKWFPWLPGKTWQVGQGQPTSYYD